MLEQESHIVLDPPVLPSRSRADTTGMFQGSEKLMAQERIVISREPIPVIAFNTIQAIDGFGNETVVC